MTIDPLAVIGHPPEHRDWTPGGKSYPPEIDKTAQVNALATVDAGLHEPTRIGPKTLVMKACHIGHDAQIGSGCELAPHVVIGGHVKIGNGVKIGIGVVVRPEMVIGNGARIGAGAVVVTNVPDDAVYVGNPAHSIERDGRYSGAMKRVDALSARVAELERAIKPEPEPKQPTLDWDV